MSLTSVKIKYQFFTSEKNRTSPSQMARMRTNSSQLKNEKDVKFEHRCQTPKIIEIDHTQISHFPKVKIWNQFFTRCEICEMRNLRFNKAEWFSPFLSIGPVYFLLKGCWGVYFIFIQILTEHSLSKRWRL